MIVHSIPPVFDGNSEILILGSFPSVRSREEGFFYAHPQNRFWRVLASVLESEIPHTVEEKREMLLRHHIALWDVIGACEIEGSADVSIRSVLPNNVGELLHRTRIRHVFVNGKTAEKYYNRYLRERLGMEATCLPSTSPANAAWSVDRLTDAWRMIVITLLGKEDFK